MFGLGLGNVSIDAEADIIPAPSFRMRSDSSSEPLEEAQPLVMSKDIEEVNDTAREHMWIRRFINYIKNILKC